MTPRQLAKSVTSAVLVVLLGAGIGLLVGSCGVRPTPVITGNAAPQGAVSGLLLYFLADGKLRPVVRPSNSTDEQTTFRQLAAGPLDSEKAGGLSSQVPNVPFKFGYNSDGTGSMYVSLVTGDSALSDLAVDQIVCTLIATRTAFGQKYPNLRVSVGDSTRYWPPRACPAQTP